MKKWLSQFAWFRGVEDEVLLALGLFVLSACALLAHRFVRRFLASLTRNGHLPTRMARRLSQVVGWMLLVLVLAVALQRTHVFVEAWDVFSAIFIATAVGFIALWSVLSNAVCAVFILVMRPFRFNDYIEILEPADKKPGVEGRVVDLSLMFTTIEVEDRHDALVLCRVPNTIFFTKGVRVTIPKPFRHANSFYGEKPPLIIHPAQSGASLEDEARDPDPRSSR